MANKIVGHGARITIDGVSMNMDNMTFTHKHDGSIEITAQSAAANRDAEIRDAEIQAAIMAKDKNKELQTQAEKCAMFLQGYWTACIISGVPLPEEFNVHIQIAQMILDGDTVASNYKNLVTAMIDLVSKLEGDAEDRAKAQLKSFGNPKKTRRIVTNLNT